MHTSVAVEQKGDRARARAFLILTVALQLLHICWVAALPHAILASNILQLCFPLLVVALGVLQGRATASATARHCWYALAAAFGIWEAAQAIFLYILYAPLPNLWAVRPDDVLWLVFGLPLLLALTTTEQEADLVTWLDRAQTMLFFVVLYALVFIPSQRLVMNKAYLIQNVALLVCCIFRLPTCANALERRFFSRLGGFLFFYTVCESIGEVLYRHGWTMGGPVDLCWSLPVAYFVIHTALDLLKREQPANERAFLRDTARAFPGWNIALMTLLSMSLSALLILRSPFPGGLCLAGVFAIFAMRTNARERLWQQAHRQLQQTLLRDALTGLGNRLELSRGLAERLALPAVRRCALLFVDLDRFKQVNDRFGHALGDKLLVEVGRRITAASSPDAVLCRLGGDEFVVLTDAADLAEAEAAGQALLQALHVPFHLGVHQLRCSASIGIVMAGADDNADDLMRTADHAMYRAKQKGRDQVQTFDADLRADLNSRRQLERDLRACVEADGIDVAFQPIYSVEKGGICGFEALARWAHPTLGNIPPADFITIAEESGLITQLGAQVMEKACQQMARWNRSWGTSLSVSVNVSPRQFADPDLVTKLLQTLARVDLPPDLLRLEITETALLLHDGSIRNTLTKAREHGIRISLDDFGTGYSSLSFLLSLPVDEVKVDRSFVSHMYRDPDRSELVRTVVHLGHTLGKRVVAEGVETEQDLLDLAEMGCECVQGYLISRPLSVAAIEADLPAITSRVRTPPGNGTNTRPQKSRELGPSRVASSRLAELQPLVSDASAASR